nr:immunoglobulin light chain junction region [Macaca mulatta]MOV77020.1 immunoglobulin light chain junction region [Macaca mulatta]
CQQRNSYPWTF